jgi:predicted permease
MRFIREPVSRSGMIWNWRYDRVIARLRPGAGIDRARAELETVASRIAAERPASNAGWTVTVERLHDSIVGSFRRVSWLLLASVVVILLVACLNVGGLLIARAIARERETAVRVALGAGRLRVIGLWLAEASTIATAGGVVGVLLGWWGLLALKAAAPPGIPRIEAIALDWQALASVAVSIGLAIVIFTLAPLPPGHRRLADRLRSGGSASDAPARSLLGTALTMAQCAGATVLVVLAVLLTRSFIQLMGVDLGWNPAGIVRFNVSPRTPPELRSPWFVYVDWSDRLIGELEALPEVERAAVTTQVPLSPDSFPATLGRGRGAAAKDEGRWPSIRHSVSDGYFNVMGIRLVSGRLFDGVDRYNEAQLTGKAPRDRGVAIVSAQTARVLWPDRPALGESIWGADNVDGIREVVGVVEDIQFHAVGETPALHVFIPWTQAPTGRPRLLARARDLTPATIDSMRAVIERMEPDTRIESIVPLEDLVGNATAQPRFASRIVAGFGGLALVLAAVGVYGTLASLVRARRQELGIRIALGAPLNAIVSRVLVQAFVPAAVGALIGLGTAAALAGRFRALLFNIEPLDRSSYFFGAIILLLVALAAALAPALRASRIDPAQTLKAE